MREIYRDIPPEPSEQATAIMIDDPEHLERLKLKSEEYSERARGLTERVAYIDPDEIIRRHGKEIFKGPILHHVIEAATARDTAVDPIVITEVALAVGEDTGYDLSLSAIIPFRFNQDWGMYEPDMERLQAEATPADIAFSGAYFIIKARANNDLRGLQGGTGLPQLPVDG